MAASGPAQFAGSSRRFPTLAKYEVVEELGHGGMATVYRAHDPRLGRDVAIKVIHPHLRDSAEVAHRFFIEAKAVAKLRHDNIVEVFDVSAPEEPEQYLVVELLRGCTLRKLLQRHGALPPEVAAAIGIELLGALAHAHGAGVIHRDIKPENVMVEHVKGSGGHGAERVKIKLTDFGIAKLLDGQGVTSTGQVLGSPAHMAPEQIEGGDVDARADVFGLGVLLYECMVGHLPFEGTNPAQVLRRVLDGVYSSAERERGTVGKAWSTRLDGALAHDPEQRFVDANAMRQAFCQELDRLGIENGKEEIESWLDEPEAYEIAHDKRLIERLVERAARARREGDTLAAACDYNRALAYAPLDKELLRIVSSMHRAEARARLVRKMAPILLGTVLLGTTAFFVTRAIKGSPGITRPDVALVTTPSAVLPILVPSGVPSSKPVVSARISAPPVPAPAPIRSAIAAPKAIERTITINSVRPQFGVSIAVDDAASASATSGMRVAIDGLPHTLKFTCANDACEPEQRALAAGDQPESLDVAMKIKPALLTIDGDPKGTYRVTEDPTISPRAGVPARVSMKGSRAVVHVVELTSGRTESATLLAGKETHVGFAQEAP
jgi:eukaryotic-like serine/threonine-protein kinase